MMTFYENSAETGVWFLRNERGHIVSPHFAHFVDLVEHVSTNDDDLEEVNDGWDE